MNDKCVRERILDTASRLFYEQGYRSTGINQIIKEADSAKASFYQHFESKEALCAEYLEQRHTEAHQRHKDIISTGATPEERVLNLFENIRQNAVKFSFNGCHFLNIASEINEHDSILRKIVARHKSKLIGLIEEQLSGRQNSRELAEMIYVTYEGANIAIKNYRDLWPVDRAEETVRHLLSGGA